MADDAGVPEAEQELSLDDAMAMVRDLVGQKKIGPAIDLLEHILTFVQDRADVWSYLAVARFHGNGPAQCKNVLLRAIEAVPNDAGLYNNLGNVCAELGDVQGAVDAYEKAIDLDPKQADAFCNLASIVKHAGNPEFAERLLRTAISLRDDFGLAYQNLAALLLSQGRPREAIDQFWKAAVYLPRPAMPMQLLALAYWHAGLQSEAVDLIRKWGAENPEDEQARHMLAAMTGESVPDQASPVYVTKLFDSFANSFDSKLDDLEYRAPQLIAEAVTAAVGKNATGLTILDAGCGTGKCAKYLRPYAGELVGVDLSSKMMEKAQRLGAYDELVCAELTAYVDENPGRFDVIASADTLCYFGKVDAFSNAAARSLRPGGTLLFTVEELPDPSQDYRLAVHGRYEHSENYVRRCLGDAGLSVTNLDRQKLRNENAQPVMGLVVTAVRAQVQ